MTLKCYNDLIVWQRAIDMVEDVYRASDAFPKNEVYGLTSQLRRAAVSVPSNIAEGQSRRSTSEFMYSLSIARGSLAEVETQIIIASRLTYLSDQQKSALLERAAEVGRLLNGLIKSLEPNL